MGSEKAQVESHKNLLCLDGDLDLLYSLLKEIDTGLTKSKTMELMKYTMNLDTNLRKSIGHIRSSLQHEQDESVDNHSETTNEDDDSKNSQEEEFESGRSDPSEFDELDAAGSALLQSQPRDATPNLNARKGNARVPHATVIRLPAPQVMMDRWLQKEKLPMPAGKVIKLRENKK